MISDQSKALAASLQVAPSLEDDYRRLQDELVKTQDQIDALNQDYNTSIAPLNIQRDVLEVALAEYHNELNPASADPLQTDVPFSLDQLAAVENDPSEPEANV